MCGITGIYSPGATIDSSVIDAMTASLRHRGPDDFGVFADAQNGVGLGHTRLSVIDLSANGKQPMSNAAGNITLCYNGEIYNYLEIKRELVGLGHSFVTQTDTEVVLKSYEQWGMDSLRRFRGMFAFAIWDSARQSLFLARDRPGVKPLYYYHYRNLFLFASELKALAAHPQFDKRLNRRALSLFFRHDYIRAPLCIFENAHKLEPGHWLCVKNGEVTKRRYWRIADSYNAPPLAVSEQDIADELEHKLIESFKYRLVSDVPVGLFLSGGIDSSAVAAILSRHGGGRIKTFTIGFRRQKNDEAPYAKKVADYLGADHTEYYMSDQDALNIVPQLPTMYDEPFADISQVPTALVAGLARQDVTVALSADGGDELFCGYPVYHKTCDKFNKFRRMSPALRRAALMAFGAIGTARFNRSKKLAKLKRSYNTLRYAHEDDLPGLYQYRRGGWTWDKSADLFVDEVDSHADTLRDYFAQAAGAGALHQMMSADFNTYLPEDLLAKVDRATMRVGLEAREPFLDHELIEFVARIPSAYKHHGGDNKYILKKVLRKYLPAALFERPKMGFVGPIDLHPQGALRDLIGHYLSESAIKQDGIFNANVVKGWLARPKFNNGEIWRMLMFQMWREKWL